MTDLEAIARAENAGSDDQREVLEDAWEIIAPSLPRDGLGDKVRRFGQYIDAKAHLDAAMMLVPVSMAWSLYSDGPTYDASATIGPHPRKGELLEDRYIGEASTPALALVVAALRNHLTKEPSNEHS